MSRVRVFYVTVRAIDLEIPETAHLLHESMAESLLRANTVVVGQSQKWESRVVSYGAGEVGSLGAMAKQSLAKKIMSDASVSLAARIAERMLEEDL